MLEQAVNARIRVLEDMRGRRSSRRRATEYGLLSLGVGVVIVGCQYLMRIPRRAASLFQGPALAVNVVRYV